MKTKYLLYYLIFQTILSCIKKQEEVHVISPLEPLQKWDSLKLESTLKEDFPADKFLEERLHPIRDNFKRINATTQWTKVITKELWESTEGGEAKFYYQNNVLEKIVSKFFGETYLHLNEYYFLEGNLSFVYEKSYQYNRPIYYDERMMNENFDTEYFDFEKSQIVEVRNYFENRKLILQISSENCCNPLSPEYFKQERVRILSELNKVWETIQ